MNMCWCTFASKVVNCVVTAARYVFQWVPGAVIALLWSQVITAISHIWMSHTGRPRVGTLCGENVLFTMKHPPRLWWIFTNTGFKRGFDSDRIFTEVIFKKELRLCTWACWWCIQLRQGRGPLTPTLGGIKAWCLWKVQRWLHTLANVWTHSPALYQSVRDLP